MPAQYDGTPDDMWQALTTEEWQPGKVAGNASTNTNPMKDLECSGPQTAMVSDPGLSWAMVKESLHGKLSDLQEDPWLLNVCVLIQREEPDHCVIGVTSTSALLLPLTMKKVRNVARMLSTDQDLLTLNVTFYDIARSGFPTFGILDGLSTPDFRAHYPEVADPCDGDAAARALRESLAAGRRGEWRRIPSELALAVFAAGAGAFASCPLPIAAALVVQALARAESEESFREGTARDEALRDVIELVSRAEELIRDYKWSKEVDFGRIVASDWNLWWLLHRLQVTLPRLLPYEHLKWW